MGIESSSEAINATAFGPNCHQGYPGMPSFLHQTRPLAEECLYLNIWRPANASSRALLPIMVWIHGGSHQSGAGSQAPYQANQLVDNGTVLVTINYRLGVFGYIAHPALSAADPRGVSGNYGLLDQVAALAWVRNNIEALNFGVSGNFSSTQEYLLYKELASKFEHSAVALFFLPSNDFTDNDPEYFDDTRYRPYLKVE